VHTTTMQNFITIGSVAYERIEVPVVTSDQVTNKVQIICLSVSELKEPCCSRFNPITEKTHIRVCDFYTLSVIYTHECGFDTYESYYNTQNV
jgi:hypothetical protein